MSAASRVKDIQPSEIIRVTGGTFEDEVSMSLERRLQNGTRQFFEVELQSEATSWLTSATDGGRPLGMVSKLKFGNPSRELGPLDLSKH